MFIHNAPEKWIIRLSTFRARHPVTCPEPLGGIESDHRAL
jgi:hypothetical protein